MARPFVKWAGGKGQLLDKIAQSLPANFANNNEVCYVEPFVGGGAVLLWMLQNYPNITRAVINDLNSELISTYRVVKTNVDTLVVRLKEIENEYLALNDEERKEYYLTKRVLFNKKSHDNIDMSALFIFLNKTCFNGLYRVNSKGAFNVPHGRYANPRICDAENLIAVSKVLQKVEILCGDFEQTIAYADENSFFYFDPPYKPLTESSSFTAYTSSGFNDGEQVRLMNFCNKIAQRKAMFIESNSDADNRFFDNLYNQFQIKRITAIRTINSVASRRGELNEIIISNYHHH